MACAHAIPMDDAGSEGVRARAARGVAPADWPPALRNATKRLSALRREAAARCERGDCPAAISHL